MKRNKLVQPAAGAIKKPVSNRNRLFRAGALIIYSRLENFVVEFVVRIQVSFFGLVIQT